MLLTWGVRVLVCLGGVLLRARGGSRGVGGGIRVEGVQVRLLICVRGRCGAGVLLSTPGQGGQLLCCGVDGLAVQFWVTLEPR